MGNGSDVSMVRVWLKSQDVHIGRTGDVARWFVLLFFGERNLMCDSPAVRM